jgi:hypothetical protein
MIFNLTPPTPASILSATQRLIPLLVGSTARFRLKQMRSSAPQLQRSKCYGVTRWATPRGTLALWAATPSLVVGRVRGHLEDAFVDAMLAQGEASLRAEGKTRTYHDWEESTGYTPIARLRLTEWTLRHLGSMQEMHILVRSRLLAMGVEVARLTLGGRVLVPYVDRRLYENHLLTALDALGIRPPPPEAFTPSFLNF